MLERTIEAYLRKRVADMGGWAYKFTSPGCAGVADRIVCLPGGVVWFIELKSPTGTLSPHQKLFAANMAALGQNYVVLNSKEAVNEWVKTVSN